MRSYELCIHCVRVMSVAHSHQVKSWCNTYGCLYRNWESKKSCTRRDGWVTLSRGWRSYEIIESFGESVERRCDQATKLFLIKKKNIFVDRAEDFSIPLITNRTALRNGNSRLSK